MDRGPERDDLVVGIQAGVDLPLIGRTDLGEGGATCGHAKADEPQRVACRPAIADEVDDGVAFACPARNTNTSLPALAVSRSAPAPPSSVLLPALPKILDHQRPQISEGNCQARALARSINSAHDLRLNKRL